MTLILPVVSDHETRRRTLMAKASGAILAAMGEFSGEADGLTPLEWARVLGEVQARMVAIGLRDEWRVDAEAREGGEGRWP